MILALKFVLSLFLTPGLSIETALPGTIIDTIVATVENEIITLSDLENLKTQIKNEGLSDPNIMVGLDAERVLKNRELLMKALIRDRILLIEVERLGLSATSDVIDAEISKIARRNNLTRSQLSDALQSQGTTLERYKEFLKTSIERQNLIENEIVSKIKISEQEISERFLKTSDQTESMTFEYALAQMQFPTDRASEAKNVYEKLNDGESFELLANMHSESSVGGYLGRFKGPELSKPFREALSEIEQGQFTKPLKIGDSIHILKVIEKKLISNPVYEKAKAKIEAELKQEAVTDAIVSWFDEKSSQFTIKTYEGVD